MHTYRGANVQNTTWINPMSTHTQSVRNHLDARNAIMTDLDLRGLDFTAADFGGTLLCVLMY